MTGAVPRLVMLTDDVADPLRTEESVEAALRGGVDCVQVRMPHATARATAAICERLLPIVHAHGGQLVVNDRADLAAAGLADGVHLGQRALPVELVRRFLPDASIGVSTHDPAELEAARRGGADHAFLSPVFPTASKPDTPALGIARAREWTVDADLPVLWLGGITAARLRDLDHPVGLAGVAALSPFADPERSEANARALIAALAAIVVAP